MASLKSRLDQVRERETKLPLVVLDHMLPRQVCKIRVNNPVLLDLVRTRVANEEPYFGMTGLARSPHTGQTVHLTAGVRVEIVGIPVVDDDGLEIELRADQLFRIVGEVDHDTAGGWTEARVEFLNHEDEQDPSKLEQETDRIGLHRATTKARKLPGLVNQWIELAAAREQYTGQIRQLLADLGKLPSAHQPSDRAMWVGALINSVPALGVALEIRPTLLSARKPEQRVNIALAGIEESIQHMKDEPLQP